MLTNHQVTSGLVILIAIIFLSVIRSEEEAKEEKEEEKRLVVPECKYELIDEQYVCPNVSTGGTIPKLMQTRRHRILQEYNPPSMELLDKVREQCIEVCVLPCLPMHMLSLIGECDVDISSFDLSMDVFCDKKKQKVGKVCAATIFRKHKNEYMDLFNKKIHIICQLCFSFYDCYQRVKKELGIK